MISNIFNITFSIDESVLTQWENWYTDFQKKAFEKGQISRIRFLELKGQQEPGQVAKCMHLEFESTAHVHGFYTTTYTEMGQELAQLFGEKCLYFGSLLELISEKSSD